MNTYVLGPLLAASVLLPAVIAWAIGHTYRTTKIILWVIWVLLWCAAGGLWSYAGDKTTLLKGLDGWVYTIILVANFVPFIGAIDSPFEPQKPRKSKSVAVLKVHSDSNKVSTKKDKVED